MEKLDSKIIMLNNQKYLIYLKRINVKSNSKGKHAKKIRAFVKKFDRKINFGEKKMEKCVFCGNDTNSPDGMCEDCWIEIMTDNKSNKS